VETHVVSSPADAGLAAARLNQPVALKILSRQISHKSDVGGVKLNLDGATMVEAAAHEMLAAIQRNAPGARVDGFTVQPMIRRPHAQELILGAVADPTFGPCLLFGHGGVATEVIADREVGLPPLNSVLARAMIARTRVARLLSGYRDRAPADIDSVVGALVALSDLVIDRPEIVELDINPLLADDKGSIALDARIIVRRLPAKVGGELAIRPYPRDLRRSIRDGERVIDLRPVRPHDAAAFSDLLRQAHAGGPCPPFGESADSTAARLSQIDYDREMSFVAVDADGGALGLAWLRFDPEFETAEYATFVPSERWEPDGRILLDCALAYARTRGARRAWCNLSARDTAAIAAMQRMGASIVEAGVPDYVRCTFELGG
jgi:acetyltransferase